MPNGPNFGVASRRRACSRRVPRRAAVVCGVAAVSTCIWRSRQVVLRRLSSFGAPDFETLALAISGEHFESGLRGHRPNDVKKNAWLLAVTRYRSLEVESNSELRK